jgi:hypothetical protein
LSLPEQESRFPETQGSFGVSVAGFYAVGVTLRSQGLTVLLDPTTLPTGSLEFVVTTEGGPERRYVLSESNRAQIR